jgi:hypothetical protein
MAWGGSAPNKVFTRTDGTRSGAAVCAEEKLALLNDTAALADLRENDLAAGLNLCLTRDGGTTPTTAIPFNDQRLTGLGAATARTDAMRLAQFQDGTAAYAEYSGTANAIALTTTPTCTPVEGMVIGFFAEADNSAATTVNLNAGGALALQVAGAACIGGEVQDTQYHEIAFDGTQWQLANPLGANWANVTAFAGVTGATGKVFVFSAAGAGALVDRTDLGLPAGTVCVFNQTAAPTGWTKDTTNNNNSAFRLVTGSVGTGGSVDFTTAFASTTPTGTVGGTAITVAQLPVHRHFGFADENVAVAGTPPADSLNQVPVSTSGSGDPRYSMSATATEATVGRSGPTGSDNTHTHTWTGNAITTLAVKYVDLIRATKAA